MNLPDLGLWVLELLTLAATATLAILLMARLARDAGAPFRQKWARERWYWALQKIATQSYIQFVALFILLVAFDEYLLYPNIVIKACREVLLVLWSCLLTNSWTLALDPLGRTFLIVQPIRFFGLRALALLTGAFAAWVIVIRSMEASKENGGSASSLADSARDSGLMVRMWLAYLFSVTALGFAYAIYQLFIFRVLHRTVGTTRGLFLRQGNTNSGVLSALVAAQRVTSSRMPGLPRKVLRQLRIDLEWRALSSLYTLTALILAALAAKLFLIALQFFLIEVTLYPNSTWRNDATLGIAEFCLRCFTLRTIGFAHAVLEVLPMAFFCRRLRTPVCPIADILVPSRHRAPLRKVSYFLVFQKMASPLIVSHLRRRSWVLLR